MLAVLDRVRQDTAELNHWLGDRRAREARARYNALAPDAPPAVRFEATLRVAEHELRLGNEDRAIARFEEALALFGALDANSDRQLVAAFRLGVAHMRAGETENCVDRHVAEACILPIRGAGVHRERQHAEAATRVFGEVAANTSRSTLLHLQAVWLLNLAHMTLGTYPDGLARDQRIPPEVFGSQESFPRLRNAAPELGVATFGLSGGAVLDDLDGDGRLDLFTTTFDTAGEAQYFHNTGEGFEKRSEEANLAGLYGGLNVVSGDVDNDGDLDLFVLRGAWLEAAGRYPNSLLRNETDQARPGRTSFIDVTFDAGLGEEHFPTQTAAFADFDNDGDLDLFVGNEHGESSTGLRGEAPSFEAPSQLFRNQGDGTFVDIAEEAGVAVRAFVKGAVWGDVDGDRYPDLFLSVLGGANHLFRNRGDGTFEDIATRAGVKEPANSFPTWFWDYDGDGHLDLYVSSYRGSADSVGLVAASYFGAEVPWESARLYRGDGRGRFVDVAQRVGLERLHLPMGSNFGDIDSDGWLDFYLGTGYPDYEGLMPNVLYHNEAGQRFRDVTWPAGVGHLQKGHGVAFGDWDRDGDIDLFAQMGGAFPGDAYRDAFFENPGFKNHWLEVELVGVRSNRSAIGARIRADILEGGAGRSIYRWVTSGGSFGCNPLRQTIGTGRATRIERLEVYWPTSDVTEVFENVAVDRSVRLLEGSGELVAARVG